MWAAAELMMMQQVLLYTLHVLCSLLRVLCSLLHVPLALHLLDLPGQCVAACVLFVSPSIDSTPSHPPHHHLSVASLPSHPPH